MSALAASGALQPVPAAEPPSSSKMRSIPTGWVSLYNDTTVIAWNPKRLQAQGLRPPASLADLTKPEWNGKISLNATAYNWYAGLAEIDPNAQEAHQENRREPSVDHPRPYQHGHADGSRRIHGDADGARYLADKDHRAGLPIDFINPSRCSSDSVRSVSSPARRTPTPGACCSTGCFQEGRQDDRRA